MPDEDTTPAFVSQYLDVVTAHRPDTSVDNERSAYESLRVCIEQENDADMKRFMFDRLNYYCKAFGDEHQMLLSYVRDHLWENEIDKERKLHSETQPFELLLALENILASYSKCSGYTKRNAFVDRYPLVVPRADGTTSKECDIAVQGPQLHAGEFVASYYAFGVHHFYVGNALHRLIEFLEERYNLNFKELERARKP